jgi:hypothetical protein
LFVAPAGQDPFGSVPTARLARRPSVPEQQPPLSTSAGSPFPAADPLVPASLFALPSQLSGGPDSPARRTRPHDWHLGKGCP